MTEPGKMTEMDALDDLFAQVRAAEPLPDHGLLARVMMDAMQVNKDRADLVAKTRKPVKPDGRFAGLLAALGGWPTLGGLAMATATGLYIGVSPPASLTAIGTAVWGETVTVSLDDPLDLSGLEG